MIVPKSARSPFWSCFIPQRDAKRNDLVYVVLIAQVAHALAAVVLVLLMLAPVFSGFKAWIRRLNVALE